MRNHRNQTDLAATEAMLHSDALQLSISSRATQNLHPDTTTARHSGPHNNGRSPLSEMAFYCARNCCVTNSDRTIIKVTRLSCMSVSNPSPAQTYRKYTFPCTEWSTIGRTYCRSTPHMVDPLITPVRRTRQLPADYVLFFCLFERTILLIPRKWSNEFNLMTLQRCRFWVGVGGTRNSSNFFMDTYSKPIRVTGMDPTQQRKPNWGVKELFVKGFLVRVAVWCNW
ncbi:hypothetical protein EDB86DRAFT_501706 [Lactarius hatsudake]|nr:hypothetical protein EDB86DRAFT_501706 [Lactarius hatsudake]